MRSFFAGTLWIVILIFFLQGCKVKNSINNNTDVSPTSTSGLSTSVGGGDAFDKTVYRIRPRTPETIDNLYNLLEANNVSYTTLPEGDVVVKINGATKISLENKIEAEAQIIRYTVNAQKSGSKFDSNKIQLLTPEEFGLERVKKIHSKNIKEVMKQIELLRSPQMNLQGKSIPKMRSFESGANTKANSPISLTAAKKGKVDLSMSQYFPPIVLQKQRTCVTHALGYYYFSYANAKGKNLVIQGADVTEDFLNKNICSPYFIFPMINGGQNRGTQLINGFDAIYKVGCASKFDYPEPPGDSVLTAPSSQDIRNAMNMRLANGQRYEFMLDDEGIEAVKAMLDLGQVVPSAMIVYKDFYDYPEQRRKFISNDVVFRSSGVSDGGHAIAIVGYDDNKAYTEVDDQGTETEKTGAFLYANSWAANWGVPNTSGIDPLSRGFFWIGYDYLKSSSEFYALFAKDAIDVQPVHVGLFTTASSTNIVGLPKPFRDWYDDPAEPFSDLETSIPVLMRESTYVANNSTLTKYPIDLSPLVNSSGIVTIKSSDLTFLNSFTLENNVNYVKTIKDNILTISITPQVTISTTSQGTLAISADKSALNASQNTIITYAFTMPPYRFIKSDIKVTNGTISAFKCPTQTSCTSTFTPAKNFFGTANISVAKFIVDSVGKPAGKGASFDINVDSTRPTVSIAVAQKKLVPGQNAILSFNFSEIPAGFTSSDVTVTNGTLGILTCEVKMCMATFTPKTNFSGSAKITVTGFYTDIAGNAGSKSALLILSVDNIVPSVTLSVVTTQIGFGKTAKLSFKFNKKPVGFGAKSIQVDSGAIGAVTCLSLVCVATYTPEQGVNHKGVKISAYEAGYKDINGIQGRASNIVFLNTTGIK